MADIFGKIANGINAANALGSALGLKSKSKKTKQELKQNPRSVMAKERAISEKMSNFSFPGDLGESYFVMGFKEYKYQSNSKRAQPLTASGPHVFLPFPKELKQAYGVEYAADEVGPFLKELIDEAGGQGNLQGAFENILRGELGGSLSTLAPVAAAAGKALTRGTVSAVLGSTGLKTAIGLLGGIAENPNDRALLKKVPLREHTFNWTLSPRNKKELDTLKQIYNVIRKKMHPARTGFSGGQYLLAYPDVVDVGFINGIDMAFFKTAAIKNFEMDMAPGGAVSFFQTENAEPVMYNMTLTIIELEAIDREDFT